MICKYFIIDMQTEEIVRETQNLQDIIIALNLEMLYIENKDIIKLNKYDPINFIFSQVNFFPNPKNDFTIIYYKKMVGKNGLKYPCIIELSLENSKEDFKEIAKIIYNLSGKQYKIEMRKFNLNKQLYNNSALQDNSVLEETVSVNQKEVLKMLDEYYDTAPIVNSIDVVETEKMLDVIKGVKLINLDLILNCKKNTLTFGKKIKWDDEDNTFAVTSIDDLSKFLGLEIHYYIFNDKYTIQEISHIYQEYSINILKTFNTMDIVPKLCAVYNPKVNQAILICLNNKPLDKFLHYKTEINNLAKKSC
ncbi:hypothetical protein AN639_10605 [Candidatus Epulonipiscium fishelsonii]|uniref:Uncharacterized protein n=1 Tax=Candidatus Epulonipiscium fishelsonii TaxID=77094 RepID=A0ACC8XA82_9FIRM|nr:hypothetical protein AN396_09415 [Epulopiscium sp. SCG-B11WGA-EpuloA1]ONI43340.1 hypothetical protein AN639_10605 [Epulopiscium sp. SCG-B05WGA-EpuloA1]